MDNNVSLPKNTTVATKYLEHQQRMKEFGVMGWFFGGGQEKPGNIAGFILVVCFLALGLIGATNMDLVKEHVTEIVTGIGGLITLTIGYVFGKKSSE